MNTNINYFGNFDEIKVMHIISPIRFGGGESLLLNLFKEKLNNNSFVFSCFYSKEFDDKLSEIGIENYKLTNLSLNDGVSKKLIFLYTLFILFKIFYLFQIIEKKKPNIIHTHGFPGNLFVPILKSKFKNIKFIDTRHFYINDHGILQKFIFNYIYSFYSNITCVSFTVLDSFNKNYPNYKNKSLLIYNCIGRDFYLPYKKRKKDKIILIQIARFSEFKNHLLVVNAVNKLPILILKKIEIWFIGDGDKRSYIERTVKKLNLNQYFKFYGYISNDKIPEILENADFALFPSEIEGFGIGAVECMAKGLPVLCLDNLLMKEIIQETGVMINKNNFDKGILDLIDKYEQLASNAILRAFNFHPSKISQEYLILYNKVILTNESLNNPRKSES